MEAKIRVVWLQSEKRLQPPKSGRGKEEILSYSLQRECKLTDTSILDFRPPELREKKFLVFKKKRKLSICDNLLKQLQETKYIWISENQHVIS